jgi:nickel-dependent lactate racemase
MINFGEIIASHQQAVDFARRYCEVEVPRRYATVVTSAAGYPLDKTYYQTIKGMVGAINLLEPGGDLIIASECSEGMGSSEFVDAQRRLAQYGPTRFLESILAKSHADIDEWQTQMQLAPMSVGNLYLYSDRLSNADRELTGVHCVDSLDRAVQQSLGRQPIERRALAVIPEGPYVIPFVRGAPSPGTTPSPHR